MKSVEMLFFLCHFSVSGFRKGTIGRGYENKARADHLGVRVKLIPM